MRKPTALDWVGATLIWAAVTGFTAAFVHLTSNVSEAAATVGAWATFLGGIAVARVLILRRPSNEPTTAVGDGLSTGEMTAERLADMEGRIYELEGRLELTERLLAETRERPRLPLVREDTPV